MLPFYITTTTKIFIKKIQKSNKQNNGKTYGMRNGSQKNAIALVGHALENDLYITLEQTTLDILLGFFGERLRRLGTVSLALKAWTLETRQLKSYLVVVGQEEHSEGATITNVLDNR